MKKITTTFLAILSTIVLFAQVPQAFKYQAVARDNTGEILANKDVSFQISILQGSSGGTSVYMETHDATTNEFGLVGLEIGTGAIVSGVFVDIDWGGDIYFLQIEMDETGGSNYQLVGTSQLLSVPYALHAETSDDSVWSSNGNNIYYQDGNVGIGTESPDEKLQVVDGNIRIGDITEDDGSTEGYGDRLYFSGGDDWPSWDSENSDPLWMARFNADENASEIRVGIGDDDWGEDKFAIGIESGTDWNPLMSVLSTGNVGIGTTTPTNPLHISIDGHPFPLKIESNVGSTGIQITTPKTNASIGTLYTTGNGNQWYNYAMYDQFIFREEIESKPVLTLKNSGSVGMGTSNPSESAVLELNSNSKGFLPPRMTEVEIKTILNPVEGLIVYNTDDKRFYFYDGNSYEWKEIAIGAGSLTPECGTYTITDIDGNSYNTVQIGTQCWMKENLKTTTYNDGTSIPNITDPTDWGNLSTGAYVWYDNDISWKDLYGAMYNWYATDELNGLCPAGWHVPSDSEWTVLTDNIGGAVSNGNELKSCRQVDSPLGGDCNTTEHPRWNLSTFGMWGTDNYGFAGLPPGARNDSGEFSNMGRYGYWWSFNEHPSPCCAWGRYLSYNQDIVYVSSYPKVYGVSVRCLKD